ncbi:MAG: translation initiation factor IF-1 [Limisphaerales bacterium]
MPGDDAFKVEGRVIEVLPNGTFRAELKNGHRLTAFVAGKAKKNFAGLKSGDKVKLQLTPYDLSVGRIIMETKTD